MENKILLILVILILVIFLWLSIITFGGHKNSKNKNIQKSSSIDDNNISTSNILYTNADGDLGIDPLVNYKLTPGLVVPYLSNAIPTGWVLCDGRQLSKTEYSALYAVIGDTFNESGDNFLIPDLRGKFILGAGENLDNTGNHFGYNHYQGGYITYSIGDTGGKYTHTLTIDEMPSHNHTVNIPQHSSNEDDDGANSLMTDDQKNGALNDTGLIQINNTGGGLAHENRPPYFAANYIMFTGKI